jgi:hypothetical protein
VGTFHNDRGELHGITVVVETQAGDCLIGRFDLEDDRGLLLRDVDVHRAGDGERTRGEFLDRAARFGPWPKHRGLVLPRAEVATLRRLGEIADIA